MYLNCKPGSVKLLHNETRPLQVLLTDHKLACFLPGTTEHLSLSDIARLLGLSDKSDKDGSFTRMPVLSPEKPDEGFVTLVNHSSIRHPSSFFMMILQNCKPASVALSRWLNREVHPGFAVFKKPLVTITDDSGLKQLIGRHRSRMKGQILVNLETVRAPDIKSSTETQTQENPDKGGDGCRKK